MGGTCAAFQGEESAASIIDLQLVLVSIMQQNERVVALRQCD
jgi:hypothetical protein